MTGKQSLHRITAITLLAVLVLVMGFGMVGVVGATILTANASFESNLLNQPNGVLTNVSWSTVRNGAGTQALASPPTLFGGYIRSTVTSDMYNYEYRARLVFDIRSMPQNAIVDNATVCVYAYGKSLGNGKVDASLIDSTPKISMVAQASDFGATTFTRLANDIPYDSFPGVRYVCFPITNIAYIQASIPPNPYMTPNLNMMLTASDDVDNITPTWASSEISSVQYKSTAAGFAPNISIGYHVSENHVTGSSYSFFHRSDSQGLSTVYNNVLNLSFYNMERLKTDYNITRWFESGDLTNGWPTHADAPVDNDFLAYRNAMSYTTIPGNYVTGNHDVNNTGNYTYWDLDIPNGSSMHDYGLLFEDFAVYGLAWNGTTGYQGENLGLNATARNQMRSYFASNPTKIPLVLQHAYMDGYGTMLPVGNDLRNALISKSIVLCGHDYPATQTPGNIIRMANYNNTHILEDLWNEQNLSPNYYSGGRLYTVYKDTNGNILNLTTRDVYFYPQYEINNTQVWDISANPITAAFTPSGPISIYYPNGILFTDASTGGPTNWHWSFGDGTTSTLQNPYKQWASLGTYTVNLTVNSTLSDYSSNTTKVIVSRNFWDF